MDKHYYTPVEIIKENINGAVTKAEKPRRQLFLLGIMAGAFIALGGSASNVAVHSIANVGIARIVAGAIFPVGLMLIVFVGGELFTGNCLITMAVLSKKTTWAKKIRNLFIVYFSNLLGALIIDSLVFFSGQYNYSDGALGAYTIKVALGKVAIGPIEGVASGILCNMLVCLAILMAGASKDAGGKIWAIFFPIWAFVTAGFEHCIANMYYIPAGIMAATNPAYVAKAQELYGITAQQCESLTVLSSLKNYIPVTIGNAIGGMAFIGAMYFYIFIYNTEVHEELKENN